jgi:hypothetical protein
VTRGECGVYRKQGAREFHRAAPFLTASRQLAPRPGVSDVSRRQHHNAPPCVT